MTKFRMSKYDPKYRINGAYTLDDWTAISDIGQVFNNKVLTQSEYLRVEGEYIACIEELLKANNIANCRIDMLEKHRKIAIVKWSNGMLLFGDRLLLFVQDCLREKCWGRLIAEDFYIHFGYDYYVYIGCLLEKRSCQEIVKKHGLFYEQMHSPYAFEEFEEEDDEDME